MNTETTPYGIPLNRYQRWETREVHIGNVALGARNPIRIQSMTTTNTMDTAATVKQTIELIEAGCDYVRITAPSKRDAENLAEIRKAVRAAGFQTPLIADIHFTPNAAEVAARIVEKVRVNPGNYADRKKFQQMEYTDSEYESEIDRIRERFVPLVRICKNEGTAMRIGTNHGSLSDRIMSRYGDTPLGMVESALEFVRICREEDYHELVLSMKASNPQVMVQAYRLLVKHMIAEGMNYPLHLGVTEAGDGEDGRIKSATGIGSLLEDGLGDTIRVSLTEDPHFEVPVARALVDRIETRPGSEALPVLDDLTFDPFNYKRRTTDGVLQTGGAAVPLVIGQLPDDASINSAALADLGYRYDIGIDKWTMADMAVDFLYLGKRTLSFTPPGGLKLLLDAPQWQSTTENQSQSYPLFSLSEFTDAERHSRDANFVKLDVSDLENLDIADLLDDPTVILVLSTRRQDQRRTLRHGFQRLHELGLFTPVVLNFRFEKAELDEVRLSAASDAGSLLLDGFGDGIWIEAPQVGTAELTSVQFTILQATRTRITKTEYIACPSCGRTLFDLQSTTEKIRSRTAHLKGVKIGIMGCIVNGPGEMADADYGYVGSGPGKITLYKGQEIMEAGIASERAVDALIDLIRDDGRWVEPPK